MILNLFIRSPNPAGQPCHHCGQWIVEAKLRQGWFTFLDVTPDPLGTVHIAFYRGDNKEHLAHPPLLEGVVDPFRALCEWRWAGEKPLYSIHRCPPSGDTVQGQAWLRRER